MKSDDGLVAQVDGEVILEDGQGEADYLWLNATALDAAGRVVGVRRWDAEPPFDPREVIPFSLTLYSMGEPIDLINLLVEARAKQIPTPEE